MPMRNPVLGSGGVLIRNNIRSDNYVTGVSGWIIRRDGSAEFISGIFNGSLTVAVTNPTPGTIKINQNGITFLNELNQIVGSWQMPLTLGELSTLGLIQGITLRLNAASDAGFEATDGSTSLFRISRDSNYPGTAPAVDFRVHPNGIHFLRFSSTDPLPIYNGGVVGSTALQIPGGIIGRNTSTAATAAVGIAETQDAGLGTIQWTVVAGRRYKLFVRFRWQLSIGGAGDTANLRVRDGGAGAPTTASTLVAAFQYTSNGAANLGDEKEYTWYFGAGDLAAGTHTFGLFYLRVAGGGTVQITQTLLREFVIYDEG